MSDGEIYMKPDGSFSITHWDDEQNDLSPVPMGHLAGAVTRVMAAVPMVPKGSENAFHRYKYQSDEDICAALGPVMAAEGLALLPVHSSAQTTEHGQSHSGKVQWRTMVSERYLLIHAPSGEGIVLQTLGVGIDGEDKGLYKAFTAARKYLMKRTFHFSAEPDDPEADGFPPSKVTVKKKTPKRKRAAKKKDEPKPEETKHDEPKAKEPEAPPEQERPKEEAQAEEKKEKAPENAVTLTGNEPDPEIEKITGRFVEMLGTSSLRPENYDPAVFDSSIQYGRFNYEDIIERAKGKRSTPTAKQMRVVLSVLKNKLSSYESMQRNDDMDKNNPF